MPATSVCPACNHRVRPVPIVFGYPAPELFAAADRGKVALGGCVVTGDDPAHRCPDCGTDLVRVGGQLVVGGGCSVCGGPLDADADDGMCEECARARNFDVLLWEADDQDGELDGEIG